MTARRRRRSQGDGLSGGLASTAPFGRRLCEVTGNRARAATGSSRCSTARARSRRPGQFYMLAAEPRWERGGGRPFLPRAISVADDRPAASGVRLDFLVEGVGPGTERLCALEPGERVWVNGPLGNAFSTPREVNPGAAGAILVGGGIGIAPLALLRRGFGERGVPPRVLLGFRDRAHSGGLDALLRLAATAGGPPRHRGRPCRPPRLRHRPARRRCWPATTPTSAVVYSCGPPAMLEAVRALCAERGVACELALESPMACGFGACFGCAVPQAGRRLPAALRRRAGPRAATEVAGGEPDA